MTKKTYTKQELSDFYKELLPYRVTKTINKQTLSYIDITEYMCDRGAMVRQGDGYRPAINELKLDLYLEIDDKWEQLREQLNKAAFAKWMATKELAALEGL